MKKTTEVGAQIVNRCVTAMYNVALNPVLTAPEAGNSIPWLTEFFSIAAGGCIDAPSLIPAGGCEAGFTHSSGRQSGREQMVER